MTVSIGGRVFWGWVADYFKPVKYLVAWYKHGGLRYYSDNFRSRLVLFWFNNAVCRLRSGTSWQGVYLTEVASVVPQNKITEATSGCMTITFLGGLVGPALAAFVTGLLDMVTAASH